MGEGGYQKDFLKSIDDFQFTAIAGQAKWPDSKDPYQEHVKEMEPHSMKTDRILRAVTQPSSSPVVWAWCLN